MTDDLQDHSLKHYVKTYYYYNYYSNKWNLHDYQADGHLIDSQGSSFQRITSTQTANFLFSCQFTVK